MAEAPGQIETESAFEATPSLPGPPQSSEASEETKNLSGDENAEEVQPSAPEVALGEVEQQTAAEDSAAMEVEIPADFPPTQELEGVEEISTDFPDTQIVEQNLEEKHSEQSAGIVAEEAPAETGAVEEDKVADPLPVSEEGMISVPQIMEEDKVEPDQFMQTDSLQEPLPTELVSPPAALVTETNIPSPQPSVAKPIRDILSRLLGKDREVPPPSYNDPAYYTWQDPNRSPSPPPRRARNPSRRQLQPFARNTFGRHPQNWADWGPPNAKRRRRNSKPKKSQKVDPSLPHRKSKYRGVYWERRDQKWRARAYCMGKRYSAGSYTVEREAALAVNRLCRKLGVPLQNPQLEAIVLDDYEAPPIKPYRPRKKKRTNIFEGKYPPVKRESYGYVPYVKSEPASYYDEPMDSLDF